MIRFIQYLIGFGLNHSAHWPQVGLVSAFYQTIQYQSDLEALYMYMACTLYLPSVSRWL